MAPEVKFCSGCGTPITTPTATEESYVRSSVETVPPVSDKPVFIPEPAKTLNNKKFITISIIVAMIAVLVLGFFKYTVAEFEKASEPFAPVEEPEEMVYPENPPVEEKKESGSEWFTAAAIYNINKFYGDM